MYSPTRPYFVRALHEWMTDNTLTPYIMVNTNHLGTQVPSEYIQDGKIVLAISHTATDQLVIEDDGLSFLGRFGGVSQEVVVPMAAVMGIYAKEETSLGMWFDDKEYKTAPKDDGGFEID